MAGVVFPCECKCWGVCVCVHLCARVGVESRPALICSRRFAGAAGVPVPR